MENRKTLLFKIKNEVVLEADGDLTLNQIDEVKWSVALECEANIFDIDVELVEYAPDISDFDVTNTGMYNFKDSAFKIMTGVSLPFEIGSDAYLDAINDGSLINLLQLN